MHLFFLCSFHPFPSFSLGVIIIFFSLITAKINLCIWTFDREVLKFLYCFDNINVYRRVNNIYILPFEFSASSFSLRKACDIASKFPLTKFKWDDNTALVMCESFVPCLALFCGNLFRVFPLDFWWDLHRFYSSKNIFYPQKNEYFFTH